MHEGFFHVLLPREQEVLEMREKKKTTTEIANHFDVTNERVRQIETKVLEKIAQARKKAKAEADRQ
jgi:DNA-directed RNA polymerase sigma subunit (sigma70/sigma32)